MLRFAVNDRSRKKPKFRRFDQNQFAFVFSSYNLFHTIINPSNLYIMGFAGFEIIESRGNNERGNETKSSISRDIANRGQRYEIIGRNHCSTKTRISLFVTFNYHITFIVDFKSTESTINTTWNYWVFIVKWKGAYDYSFTLDVKCFV